ncbi:hypothetical protein LY78DRAFT_228210 [Colletotrichum sublineola]|nr:hypothetical protein LY78DRAFT_228210 [Colletotrichum sublineola]
MTKGMDGKRRCITGSMCLSQEHPFPSESENWLMNTGLWRYIGVLVSPPFFSVSLLGRTGCDGLFFFPFEIYFSLWAERIPRLCLCVLLSVGFSPKVIPTHDIPSPCPLLLLRSLPLPKYCRRFHVCVCVCVCVSENENFLRQEAEAYPPRPPYVLPVSSRLVSLFARKDGK